MKRIAVFLVLSISAFFRLLGLRACRFAPTCSSYSVDAFRRYGFGKALFLTLERFFRCHPLSPGGYDPVK